MASVNFFTQSISFKIPQPRKTSSWIRLIVEKERHLLSQLNFIFCSDDELFQMNLEFLNHKTLTDIITFDNSEVKGSVEGDIYISVDRIRENALLFRKEFDDELRRVMIHGVLHLMGYKDKTDAEKSTMRKKEDASLSLYAKARPRMQ
jgi:probable rRNA maturation factor